MKTATRRSLSAVEPVERIANDDPKLNATFSVGDVALQGDIIIVGIQRLPRSAKHRTNRQLAEGDTQGSRHILARGELFDADPAEVSSLIESATKIAGQRCVVDPRYIGPVFVGAPDPTQNDLTHPEHGNQGFPAGQVCAVIFQRNLDSEQQESRVKD